MLADGPGTPIDQGVSTLLFVAALLFGWLAYARLRGRAFHRLPIPLGWASAALAVSAIVLAVVLPPILRPDITSHRPSTNARLQILSPRPGEVVTGSPPCVDVRLRLIGGKIVPLTSTHLIPNTGHIHLYLDQALIVMTEKFTRHLCVTAGPHELEAEFVAVDHGPFQPRVLAKVHFVGKV